MKKLAHKSSGISTRMGICSFFVSLFEANELLPTRQRMTDRVIAVKISKEFPDRPSAQDFTTNKAKKTVNSYRYRYNKGKFTRGMPPRNMSFRYNEKGLHTNFKTATRVLLQEEVAFLQKKHRSNRQILLESML
jgi:hypothetical protein